MAAMEAAAIRISLFMSVSSAVHAELGVVLKHLHERFIRIELVARIIRPGARRRLSGQALRYEAEIADSSRAFGLSAGTQCKREQGRAE